MKNMFAVVISDLCIRMLYKILKLLLGVLYFSSSGFPVSFASFISYNE